MASSATAAETASISLRAVIYGPAVGPDVSLVERYKRLYSRPTQLSDNKPEADIYSPAPRMPEWLERTQSAISNSVAVSADLAVNDQRWLKQEVADAAADFFERTADLLPGEPFIYRTHEGDLVAEFKAKRGNMTSIMSPSFVLLFAVIDGVPFEKRVLDARAVRPEVQRLTERLATAPHGDLETNK